MDYQSRIKALIEDTDTRQKSMAAALGLNQSTLSNYVTGRTSTPPEVLSKISQYFHVTTDYLLGLTDDPNPPYPVSTTERAMLERFRSLSRSQKELVLQSIDLMAKQNQQDIP